MTWRKLTEKEIADASANEDPAVAAILRRMKEEYFAPRRGGGVQLIPKSSGPERQHEAIAAKGGAR